jgi:hypothetical protein
MAKKLTSRQKQALADPVTQAASDAALAEARQRFGPQMDSVIAEIKALLAGRRVGDLSGGEAVALMALKARFDDLTIEHRAFSTRPCGIGWTHWRHNPREVTAKPDRLQFEIGGDCGITGKNLT